MLIMTAFKKCTPVALVILLKIRDGLQHFEYYRGALAGVHHKKIVRAINQQNPEATTSGTSWLISCARAASTTADSIHICARLIITRIASFACQTADLPRDCGVFKLLFLTFISAYLARDCENSAVSNLQSDVVQRSRRGPVKNITCSGAEPSLMAWTLEPIVVLGIINGACQVGAFLSERSIRTIDGTNKNCRVSLIWVRKIKCGTGSQ
jgi:hypothetical protein